MATLTRRHFLKFVGGAASAGFAGLPLRAGAARGQVAVIGGGVGGVIAAKQIRKLDPSVNVTLIEQNKHYYANFMSNELFSGMRTVDTLKFNYDGLGKHGVTVLHDKVTGVDPAGKTVATQSGKKIRYDRLILAPGIGLKWDAIEGYSEKTRQRIPHAWRTGEQALALRKQLEAMKKGGVVVITVPSGALCCPSAPYERASHIAYFLKQRNRTSKVLIIDAQDSFHMQELFLSAWQQRYPGMIEWVKGSATQGGVTRVDGKAMKMFTRAEAFQADVANIIPPQRAGDIANVAGVSGNDGWCSIDPSTFESRQQKGIHVIGDACTAVDMPKSAQAAHAQAKACAYAVVAVMHGQQPARSPLIDVDYSVIAPDYGISSVGVYRVSEDNTRIVKVSGGESKAGTTADHRNREVQYAHSWFSNMTYDMFG